jgi:hypothetical protein
VPSPSTAELVRPLAFPDDLGAPLWQERRAFPVAAVFGVPAAFLVVAAILAGPLVLHIAFGLAALAAVLLVFERRRHALIETLTVTERYVAIEQPGGGRVAVPVAALTTVTVRGDHVRFDSTEGVVDFAYVRRKRTLLRALERAAPGLAFDRAAATMCLTCSVRY